MFAVPYRPSWDQRPVSLRRRVISFSLALIAHILIVWLLLRLTPDAPSVPVKERSPATFQLLPETSEAPTPAPKSQKIVKDKRSGGAPPRSAVIPTPHAPDEPKPPTAPPVPAFAWMPGGKALFEAADISKLPSHAGDRAEGGGAADGTSTGADSGSVYGPGEGPGGQRLYNAEWFREPTHAELAYYLPNGVSETSWAMIACKTIEKHHVENCRELGESPVGSGLARALCKAAWQFLVLPPRIGGRPVVGAWVRIRFDFTDRGTK